MLVKGAPGVTRSQWINMMVQSQNYKALILARDEYLHISWSWFKIFLKHWGQISITLKVAVLKYSYLLSLFTELIRSPAAVLYFFLLGLVKSNLIGSLLDTVMKRPRGLRWRSLICERSFATDSGDSHVDVALLCQDVFWSAGDIGFTLAILAGVDSWCRVQGG